jgi:UTP--glucose-1-phosphate uridylyltransferase
MAGITQIIMIVSGSKEPLEMYFDKNYELESLLTAKGKTKELAMINQTKSMAKIVFLKQLEQRGTGHAILQAREWVSDDVCMVVYGDSIYHPNFFKQAVQTYTQTGKAVMTLKEVERDEVQKYGVAEIKDGHITRIVEKPSRENAPSNLVNFSPFIIPHSMFDRLEQTQPDPKT